MTSNTETAGFSSAYDTSGNTYSFNDLEQLAKDTNILQISKDETSGLEKICLINGCFEYNSETYLNDTIKDCLIHYTAPIKNQNFPVTVSNSNYFDIHFDLKSDYFFFPASLQVTIDAKLYVRNANGSRRAIQDADCLVPIDSLQPVKNIRPYFENNCTIPTGKPIDQRNLSRVMKILTETTDKLASKRREKYSRSFFEMEKTNDNKEHKTHSHVWKEVSSKKVIKIYDIGADNSSYQNTYLSKTIKEGFQFHLDFSQVPPFNSAILYSRPCESITLNLEFCKYNDWLRICTPDGTAPPPQAANKNGLQPNFSNLELDITQITISFSQFALNQALLDYYIKKTTSDTFSNIPQQIVELHQIAAPVNKNSRSWSVVLNNIIIPERLFIYFQSDSNRNKPDGNPFFYHNLGVSQISFNVLSTSLNRYNKERKTWFGTDDTICTKSEDYEALGLNEKFRADCYAADMILQPCHLAAGHSGVGANLKYTFLTNEESIYKGQCIYCINTGMQMEINRNLKEITRKGNTEISFSFQKVTDQEYYATIFCSYSGEFIVRIFLYFSFL